MVSAVARMCFSFVSPGPDVFLGVGVVSEKSEDALKSQLPQSGLTEESKSVVLSQSRRKITAGLRGTGEKSDKRRQREG